MVDAVRRGFTKTLVAAVYNVSRKTVTKWSKRVHRHGRASYKDKKPERRDSKITLKIELTIIALRTTFDWHGENTVIYSRSPLSCSTRK